LDPLPERVFRQRLWNTALAAIGIVVTFPIMGLTAIAVRLSSPGPVLDRQVRVGLNGVPFQLYRFRSMRADAQTATHTAGPIVTRVSRLLRKMRVDGLPQLFNVLRGEMFVVGPRPERPEFVKELAEYVPFYRHRYSVRPGITGWAQINGMDGDAIEDTITKLEYDLCYIKNISLGLDFFIFYRALNIMLWSHKAH
jgi:lipopolysaccharide/colanic/teichoic acid biosynthesis glycosyltransferase